MNKKIIFKKATRIEGNANIQIEVSNKQVKTARFLVQEFRGFEGFIRNMRVEYVPQTISRICGLCSCSHQIASINAIEEALDVPTSNSVKILRDILVLGELINSHALSYFFLTMPDFIGTSSGIFELLQCYPEIAKEAFFLRNAGLKIVELIGKRTSHPVTPNIGYFNSQPSLSEIDEIRNIAKDIEIKSLNLINQLTAIHKKSDSISFPENQPLNFVTYNSSSKIFEVYNKNGHKEFEFIKEDFLSNISELRADWTLAKFPYLTKLGFPSGIILVGPLSRSFQQDSPLNDPDIKQLEIARVIRERRTNTLETYDACRLLEIFWAAKKIRSLTEQIDLKSIKCDVNFKASGQGIGVIEAPRGILVHYYIINQGKIEKIKLLVATQFNNAYINLILRELAEKYLIGDSISKEGEKLIGRCIRIFDPCLSCATH